ncbi:hypothetical protein GCM10007857_77290 [Bradyrhizobium iriomotense]|uniref:Uncharacterized protein n=1 Tax=Bradyrhizobium iriomotense TaxID=441950 RepID=A0ABQ6BFS8_9BRAD|nr:hypothetical protein [Bradyrhizobium iriomotense]GLR91013.1 hypothetical protein GCM10007857_77290 [Bradyrhizobium iriomotense]
MHALAVPGTAWDDPVGLAFLFQMDNALAQWFHTRAADARGGTRKTMMIVAPQLGLGEAIAEP